MDVIRRVEAFEVLDGRGEPTVRVDVFSADGHRGTALVPSGRSTGSHEARERRDGDPGWYAGRGVRDHLRTVLPELNRALADCPLDVRAVDERLLELDGTPDKSRLGANVTAGVSLAAARTAAAAAGLPLYRYLNPVACELPVPQVNLINGGRHAHNRTPVQEFIILPLLAAGVSEALEWTGRVSRRLAELLRDRYGEHVLNTGDEGGFTPDVPDIETGLAWLIRAVEDVGLAAKVRYGLDMAATHLYDATRQVYQIERAYPRDELFTLYGRLADEQGLLSIEDPVTEEDFEGLALLTRRVPIQLVGDDLFVTNPGRVERAASMGAGNALLWKFNQVGTISEAWDAAMAASRHGYEIVVSERSGDTEDPAIADLAVALGASQIKTGAPVRGERTAKYNRLLAIERELGRRARYAGPRLAARYGVPIPD